METYWRFVKEGHGQPKRYFRSAPPSGWTERAADCTLFAGNLQSVPRDATSVESVRVEVVESKPLRWRPAGGPRLASLEMPIP